MSSEPAVSVRNVSKVYRIYERPEHRLIQMATLGRIRRFQEFAALSDISLEVSRGETVGIVGRNGCGKSTLLQIICGTLQPSGGAVEVRGRIAALLELGAGFNGEFTGRENVYMNGAILGFSREEMDARFEGIARFADIGDFIERPVKTYSSGMFVRLAFAVATAVEPDILVVDEALAVGDEAFQRKCYARIEALKERGGTILFVSHGGQTIVQLCDRAVLIDAGEKLLEGEPKTVVNQYQRLINLSGAEAASAREAIRCLRAAEPAEEPQEALTAPQLDRVDEPLTSSEGDFDPHLVSAAVVAYESYGARISDVRLTTLAGREVNILRLGCSYRLAYQVAFSESAKDIVFGMQIKTVSGFVLTGANTLGSASSRLGGAEPGETYRVVFDFVCRMLPGTFFFDTGVMGTHDGQHRFLHRFLDVLMFRVEVESGLLAIGHVSLDPKFTLARMSDGVSTSTSYEASSSPQQERRIA